MTVRPAAAEWWFYHIEQGSVDAAIGPLLEKCLERRWRVVVAARQETIDRLDRGLWTWRDDSFLPHGAAGRQESEHPVLLSTQALPVNGARVAVLLDGTDADPHQFERIMVLFDGAEESARAKARQQYRTARESGAPARYFQQDGAGWSEKTQARSQ